MDLSARLAAPPPEVARAEPTPAREEARSFDFGDLAGGLELDRGGLSGFGPAASDPAQGGELAFETPIDFTTRAGAGGLGGGADLGPGAAVAPPSPAPTWEPEAALGSEEPLDFSSAAAAVPAAGEELLAPTTAGARPRRTPRDRPPPPKFRRQRERSGPVFALVLLVALGAGAYFGWPLVASRLSRVETPEPPAPALPELSAPLLSRLRALADDSFAEAVREADRSTAAGVPSEPEREWLRGSYLAGASQFEAVEPFWRGIEQFVQALRAADGELGERLAERIRAQGLAPDTTSMLLERARAGLAAAAPLREQAYARMEALADAALALHAFLVANDASIEYRPASTSTADPILEAVASTPAIGEQMEQRIGDYTDALDEAIGTIDRATRERLVGALLERLREVGIQ